MYGMKRRLLSAALILSLAASGAVFTACSREEEDTPESIGLEKQLDVEDNDFDDPSYDNEADGADIMKAPHEKEDFYGNWAAPSDRAEYLFGNVNLKIKEDGTWKGNVSDIKVSGRWRHDGTGIIIKDKEGYINWRLFYEADGTLMFEDIEQPDDSPLVLKPGPAVK